MPCALLHASHNTFVQGIFDPMTANVGASRLVTTEFGCGLAIAIGVTALILVRSFPLAHDPATSRPGIDRVVEGGLR